MSINSSVVTEEIISPYFFKKLVSGKSYVLVLHKVEQQVVFLWGKVCLFAVYENISCSEVYLKSFKLYGFAGRLISGFVALYYRIYASENLFGRERLYNIVVNAHLKSEQLVIFLRSCREHKYWCVLELSYLLAG